MFHYQKEKYYCFYALCVVSIFYSQIAPPCLHVSSNPIFMSPEKVSKNKKKHKNLKLLKFEIQKTPNSKTTSNFPNLKLLSLKVWENISLSLGFVTYPILRPIKNFPKFLSFEKRNP